MNSSEIVERLKRAADHETALMMFGQGALLAAASHIEAQDKLIEELREALKQERVMRMIAEGSGVEQAQIHAQVKADQDAVYIRMFLSQKDTP